MNSEMAYLMIIHNYSQNHWEEVKRVTLAQLCVTCVCIAFELGAVLGNSRKFYI